MKGSRIVVGTLAAGLLVTAGVVASASSGSGTNVKAAQATTVTLSGWKSSPVEDNLVAKVAAAFNRSHKSVKVNYVPLGDYDTTMIAKFSARKPPDVFYVNGHVFPTWVSQGVLASLSPLIKKYHFSTKPFFPRLLNGFKYKGQIYGFPKDWSPLAMFVNTAMLKKAGAKIPKTWAQLKSTAQKLKSSGAVPNGKPLCLDHDWARLFSFAYANGYKGRVLSSAGITSSAVRGAANYWVGLVKAGLGDAPANLGADWCGAAFGKEKAAITFEGNWLVPLMTTDFKGVPFKIAVLPKGKTRGNLAFTVSYSIARDAKNKGAAWTVLTYFTGKTGSKIWTSLGLALPARSDVKPAAGRAAFLKAAPYTHVWQGGPKFNDVVQVGNNELSAVYEGKQSVNGMLSKIQSAARSAGQ